MPAFNSLDCQAQLWGVVGVYNSDVIIHSKGTKLVLVAPLAALGVTWANVSKLAVDILHHKCFIGPTLNPKP